MGPRSRSPDDCGRSAGGSIGESSPALATKVQVRRHLACLRIVIPHKTRTLNARVRGRYIRNRCAGFAQSREGGFKSRRLRNRNSWSQGNFAFSCTRNGISRPWRGETDLCFQRSSALRLAIFEFRKEGSFLKQSRTTVLD